MPAFANDISAVVMPKISRWVEVCESWGDAWIYVPYLVPERFTDACAPEISSAVLSYECGFIKPEDDFIGYDFEPLELVDWYVRIMVQYPGYTPVPYFYGVVVESEVDYKSSASVMGTQMLHCKGLAFLFEREHISKAFALENGELMELDHAPMFNERHKYGFDVQGNMSADLGPDTVYVFQANDPDIQKWDNRHILEYLIEYFAPEDLGVISLTGQLSPLYDIKDVVDIGGRSLWDCFNMLIERNRGLGFFVQVDPYSQVIFLNVFTNTEFSINLGNATMPANWNQISFTYPTVFPFYHAIDDVPIRVTSQNSYDTVEVVGDRIKVTATWSMLGAGQMVKGWNDDDEKTYLNPGKGNADDNDTARASDELQHVFTRYVVDPNWDFKLDGAGGFIGQLLNTAAPNPQDDGTVLLDLDDPGDHWSGQKHFERDTCLLAGYDYTRVPPVNHNSDTDDPDFMPLTCWIKDTVDGSEHNSDKNWHRLDKLHDSNKDLHNVGVHPLANQMGIQIGFSPNHYGANGSFGKADDTNIDPELDYHQLAITATFASDARQRIKIKNPLQSGVNKTLTIHVPKAQYWVASTHTMVEVFEGDEFFINPNGCILRDDGPLLRAIAAYCQAWYFKPRMAVEIPVKSLGLYVPLGSYLVQINSVDSVEPIGTVVTSRSVDFKAYGGGGRTTISTGYHTLDFGAFAKKQGRKSRNV